MAEPIKGELVPSSPTLMLSDYMLPIKVLNERGIADRYMVPLPTSSNFNEWSVYQQVAMLKSGVMDKLPIGQILFAIAYARSKGLDIMEGDVYSTGEGRIALSNKAKIKLALRTGRISSYKVAFTELPDAPGPEGCTADYDIECTVTLGVQGLGVIQKVQRLSEWYMDKNPNWRTRPRHMLELNTFAHACELINPTDNSDEYGGPVPEPPAPLSNDDLTAKLEAAVAATT